MKTLQAYIDQMNRWNALFKGEQYEIQTSKGRQRVADSIRVYTLNLAIITTFSR